MAAGPFLKGLLRTRLRKGKEHPERFNERFGVPSQKRGPGKLLWAHAASVGESLAALPLLEELHARLPEWKILLTTGTLTSAEMIQKRLPDGVVHQFAPWDHPRWVARFMDYWRPDAALWLESELWPNMLMELQKRNVPMALLNARMSDKSLHTWQRMPQFAAQLLRGFNIILAGGRDELVRYQKLGAQGAEFVGGLKFGAKPAPVHDDVLAQMRAQIGARPCIGFLSTHAGEEEIAADMYQSLIAAQPELLLILAPRHPHRGDEIRQMLEKKNLRVAQRSKAETVSDKIDIYLADTIGEIGNWYSLCSIVIVGGSFVPHGGQNPFEATHFGCAVLYGPHMFNFNEICRTMEEANAAMRFSNENALMVFVRNLLSDPAALQARQDAARDFAAQQSGIIDAYAERILRDVVTS